MEKEAVESENLEYSAAYTTLVVKAAALASRPMPECFPEKCPHYLWGAVFASSRRVVVAFREVASLPVRLLPLRRALMTRRNGA